MPKDIHDYSEGQQVLLWLLGVIIMLLGWLFLAGGCAAILK